MIGPRTKVWSRALALVGWLVTGLPAAAAEPVPDFVALNPRGSGINQSTDPTKLIYTADLFSLTTGQLIGNFTDVITCASASIPPCAAFDVETTYRLPGGDIVNRGYWSGVPDPQRPGFLVIGTRPTTDTIVATSGRFAGRGGRVNGWGSVDARKFPTQLGYDVFTVIQLVPGQEAVVGSVEALAAEQSPAGFISQHFRSDGVNQATQPGRLTATAELFTLTRGRRHGTALDDATCSFTSGSVPCLVFDVVTVFRYPGGEITAESKVSAVPDPQRDGYLLVNTRPQRDTITATTGQFAGRTGRLLISGSIDMRQFPRQAPYEGISVIQFN
jgi:hypothetical protein